MNINTSIVNTPDMNGQENLQTNNSPNASAQQSSTAAEGKSDLDIVTIASQSGQQEGSKLQKNPSSLPGIAGTGVIGLDADKNVVVRFFDRKGKEIAQYPPEDYLQMMKQLNQSIESMFHKQA